MIRRAIFHILFYYQNGKHFLTKAPASRHPDCAPAMREEPRDSVRGRCRTGYRRSWHTPRRSNLPAEVPEAALAWGRAPSPIQCSGYRVLREAPAELRQHLARVLTPTGTVQFLHALEPLLGGLTFISLPYRTGARRDVAAPSLLGH